MSECCNTGENAPPIEPNFAVVAQGALDELKRKQTFLERGGMGSQIVTPPGGGG